MKKALLIFFIFGLFSVLAQSVGFAQSISSNELLNHPAEYDGKNIYFSGEVIGDIMVRREFAWVNLSDRNNALGVWVKKEILKEVNYTGGHKNIGDWLEVEGIFNRACREHGGDLDIHASVLKKIKSGEKIIYIPDDNKRRLSLILLAVIGGLWILMLLTKK